MVKVPDYGHRATDNQLAALSKRLQLVYRQAMLSLREKTLNYLEQFEKEDAEKRALYDSGELEHEAFIKWRKEQLMLPEQWNRMLNQLSADLTNRNEIAASMINDELPEVYALNHNYGTYEAETGSGIDTTYTMYDKATVARLVKEKQVLLPEPKVNIPKDQRWNKQHIQSAVLQGILQGESMSGIADRLASVTTMSANAAIRNARTAVTGAENAGRIDSYKRAQSLGIRMKQVWMATLDDRTRDSHAEIDGEKVEVGEKFSNGCRYPGDPQGRPEEVYNCRCTLVAEVEGSDPYNPAARPSQYLPEQGLTYEQWKNRYKGKSTASNVVSQDSVLSSSFRNKLSNITYNPCANLTQVETEDIRIFVIGGWDMTDGSCASVALAYAGRENGIDVRDFRDGESRDWFADKQNKRDMAAECGISHTLINSYDTGWEKLKSANLEDGVEYLIGYAQHMSVIRRNKNSFEYLELQSLYSNGWHKLNSGELKSRFGAKDSGRYDSLDIYDVRTCKGDKFKEILGYINTAAGQEQKVK